MLIVMLALGAAYAALVHRTTWGRWLVVGGAAALSVVGNGIRVFIVGAAHRLAGEEAALSVVHAWSGYPALALTMAGLVVTEGAPDGKLRRRGGSPAEDRDQTDRLPGIVESTRCARDHLHEPVAP